MKKQGQNELALKSEPMNEMLSHPPKWIVRSGSGLFLIIICMVISLSWLIQYPDEISGEVIVTNSKAPIELSNQSYIQLKALNVRENQEVNSGDLIAQFDLQANAGDVEDAIAYLNKLKTFKAEFLSRIPELHQKLQLGVYQEQWTNLLSKIREWNLEQSENLVAKELAFIQQEITFREQLQIISGKKIALSESEYALIEEQVSGSEHLAEQHAISKQTLIQDKRSRNQAVQNVQGQKEQYVQNLIALNGLRKEKGRLEHDTRVKWFQKSAEIQLILTGLINAFRNWERDAVWTAPCSGKIVFNKLLQVNRFYKPNEASIIVVPKGNGHLAVASVVSSGAGKLKIGQKAFIELIDYPKTEFGMLEGRVSSITQMDKEGKYELTISLSAKLRTTYSKELPPKAQLKGKVKVLTKNKQLLMRFFEQLTALIQ